MKPDLQEKRSFTESEAGTAFTLAVLLPYAAAFAISLICSAAGADGGSAAAVFCSLFATQAAFFVITAYFGKRASFEPDAFGIRKFRWKYLILAAGLSFGMLFGLGYLNIMFVDLLEKAGLSYDPVAVPLNTAGQFALCLFAVGVLPAIFEELIFRGIILSGVSRLGAYPAALLVGGMFALFHHNPAQTLYPFVTGFVFALTALRSGSVFPSMLMHLINNVVVLFLEYFAPNAAVYNVWTVAVGCVVFAACFCYLVFFDGRAARRGAVENAAPCRLKNFFVFGAAGMLCCAVVWVVTLFI